MGEVMVDFEHPVAVAGVRHVPPFKSAHFGADLLPHKSFVYAT